MKGFGFALGLAVSAGAVLLAASSQPGLAADLPVSLKDTPYVAVPWQGLYFGGHVGGVWGSTTVGDTFDYYGDPHMNGNADSTGLIGGAQAGYNFQRGHAVFGIEGDIGYLGLAAHGSDYHAGDANCLTTPKYCNIGGKYDTSGGLYGDITGRLGYAANQLLIYGKGGVAFLNADLKTHYDGQTWEYGSYNNYTGAVQFDFDHSETLVGWTVGAGLEYALNPSWSIKGEYQHFDFGNMSNSYQACHGVANACPVNGQYKAQAGYAVLTGKTDTAITADAVKFGVNYHVGGGQ